MKRKRGSKKGHKKGKRNEPVELTDPSSAQGSPNAEDTADDLKPDFETDSEPPTSEPKKASENKVPKTDRPIDNSIGKSGTGRLKVKLKSSRTSDTLRSYSDIQTPSDTEKSNQQPALESNYRNVENEDSVYSDGQTSEMEYSNSEKLPKKTSNIKIKSSKALGLSGDGILDRNITKANGSVHKQRDFAPSDDEGTPDILLHKKSQRMEVKQPYRDPRYNDKELTAALMVIKKVMKMDAAEPFNTPVDPIALGIPDYFDIIDTPMDFGTISHDLEHKRKYMNSEDVFKDVQLIWDNCYKYNNKGDYIVDLMKRVKKNFMKYWMAAGLYLDKRSNGASGRKHDDNKKSSQDKSYSKAKQKHKRRKHGIDLHKSDCLCAVCVVRRRRKEREKGLVVTESQRTNNIDFKTEGSSPVIVEFSEDATSSRDHSQDRNANAELEVEGEERLETPMQTATGEPVKQEAMDDEIHPRSYSSGSRDASLSMQIDNGDHEDSNICSQNQDIDLGCENETGDGDGADAHMQDPDQEKTHGESTESQQQAAAQERPPLEENPSIVQICRSLFPSDVKSVWNGPHSLARCFAPSSRDSPLHSALAAIMKQ